MSGEAFYLIDKRAFPKVRVSFTHLPRSDQEYAEFLENMSQLYAEKREFTMLFDTSQLGMLPLSYLKDMARWISTHREDARAYLKKSAVLITSMPVRAFIRALFLVSPPTSELELFPTLAECVDYLQWRR